MEVFSKKQAPGICFTILANKLIGLPVHFANDFFL